MRSCSCWAARCVELERRRALEGAEHRAALSEPRARQRERRGLIESPRPRSKSSTAEIELLVVLAPPRWAQRELGKPSRLTTARETIRRHVRANDPRCVFTWLGRC